MHNERNEALARLRKEADHAADKGVPAMVDPYDLLLVLPGLIHLRCQNNP